MPPAPLLPRLLGSGEWNLPSRGTCCASLRTSPPARSLVRFLQLLQQLFLRCPSRSSRDSNAPLLSFETCADAGSQLVPCSGGSNLRFQLRRSLAISE